MKIDFTVQIWREGRDYVAHAMPLDVASSGPTAAAARAALDEAVRLFLQTAEDQGTLSEVLEEAGYSLDGTQWRSPAWVGVEQASATLGA